MTIFAAGFCNNGLKTKLVAVQFKIAITKDIIRAAKDCGRENDDYTIGRNCAIAIALKDLFPDVFVTGYDIYPFGNGSDKRNSIRIALPQVAQHFIRLFDGFSLTPRLRLLLPEFEFNIEISDELIEQIDIGELKSIIRGDKSTSALKCTHRVTV